MERRIIIIGGPTCSGKTALSISLAEKLDSEIISADSRQIFKYLDIGTAKPSPEQLRKVKHHFVDSLEPDEDFNVSRFEIEALEIIEKLQSQNKIPVVAGGTGLYIRALTDGIFNEVDTDEEYRDYLLELRHQFGNEKIYEELKKADPVSAEKMLPQNWKRVMRALEVFHITGRPIWEFQENYKRQSDFIFLKFGLMWPREILYANIEKRVDGMISGGLIDEVKMLLDKGFRPSLNSLNTVGYKETIAYLNGEISLERAVELIKRNTRRYAKRQLTWFRNDDVMKWINVESIEDIEAAEVKILDELTTFEKS